MNVNKKKKKSQHKTRWQSFLDWTKEVAGWRLVFVCLIFAVSIIFGSFQIKTVVEESAILAVIIGGAKKALNFIGL